MGMLGTAAYILAMDTFGPITDNAGGIVEMSKQPEEIRKKTDRLDAVGNTTKALTKGYAIGSAALAAFLLFSAYLDELEELRRGARRASNLAKPEVFVGGLLGAMLVFFFSALAIKAVGQGRARRHPGRPRPVQGAPGHHAGHREAGLRPDRRHRDARRAEADDRAGPRRRRHADRRRASIFKQLGVGAEAVAALLMVGHHHRHRRGDVPEQRGRRLGQREEVHRDGRLRRQGLARPHKAAVVGDTVGDPFKDTAGPSLHVLIKLLATITLVLAPLFI